MGGAASEVLFKDSLKNLNITIDAPYSIAHLKSDSQRQAICIAGGSGLAPMVSILHGITQLEHVKPDPILYYGARNCRDVVDKGYFNTISGFRPDEQYIPVVSEPAQSDNWGGATGMVHDFLKTQLEDAVCDYEYYLAGPPPMVDAVRRHLVLERGVPVEQLHYDRFF